MGYSFENSNPERFQKFCQALLLSEFPGLQCFPVGQPDGGRDALQPHTKTVVQIKFKRQDEPENAEWLIGVLEAELPKIRSLISEGASRYLIVTNARGTGHPKKGRIDRVQQWFDENVSIPAQCLWRDDLDQRFDVAPNSLKLKYSELVSFEDGMGAILASVLGNDGVRQKDALRSFIATQYTKDKMVKFRQVDLSNDLLGLFVDVPIGFTASVLEHSASGNHKVPRDLSLAISGLSCGATDLARYEPEDDYQIFVEESGEPLGAASFLLQTSVQDNLNLMVLEGGPGQGKSTLTQFVCQVHRARFLGDDTFTRSLGDEHLSSAFRVPIKVDLRDYARYLAGDSPFSKDPSTSSRTLQEFLAQLIAHGSSGIGFSPHDVLVLMKETPVLLFLDGLDEVADIGARGHLLDTVRGALDQWGAFEVDVQVVVTSRPSVFGSSPDYPKLGFRVATLQDIDEDRVDEYATKWISSRRMDEDEASEIRRILGEKLELPHIQDLTRNPMQLAILLSLIHRVGHSLPDERTRLYSDYIETFLTREAEKSAKVREHRKVLLGFIQYLAWTLQSQAESAGGSGSITVADLRDLARSFLQAEGRELVIADELFGGGLERIFVLVERIEGLYEFEVQTLREYFCAGYLYSTAPVGTYLTKDAKGDRAHRFEAIAASPFWMNVCRFYAGLCERAELGTLLQSLRELIQEAEVPKALHIREVAFALLRDWVFSESQFTQGDVIRAVFDHEGTPLLLSAPGWRTGSYYLPLECGQKVLREHAFNGLLGRPKSFLNRRICSLIQVNGGSELHEEFSQLVRDSIGPERTERFSWMIQSGAVDTLEPEYICDLITSDSPDRDQLAKRIRALNFEKPDIAEKIQLIVDVFVEDVLHCGPAGHAANDISPLTVFASILQVAPSERYGYDVYRISHGMRHQPYLDRLDRSQLPTDVRDFLIHMIDEARGSNRDDWFDGALDFREKAVEVSLAAFGPTWAAHAIALQTAGISSFDVRDTNLQSLFSEEIPLCKRTRLARLKRAGSEWWLEQLEGARTSIDRMFWLGLVTLWSSMRVVESMIPQISQCADSLSYEEFSVLRRTLQNISRSSKPREDRRKLKSYDLAPISDRTAILLLCALPLEPESFELSSAQAQNQEIDHMFKVHELSKRLRERPEWKDEANVRAWITHLSEWRALDTRSSVDLSPVVPKGRLSRDAVSNIATYANELPTFIVTPAISRLQASYRPKNMVETVKEQQWDSFLGFGGKESPRKQQ